LSRDEVLGRRDQAKTDLEDFIEACDADLAPLLHEALQAPIADYKVLKAKAGELDFLDLLIKARDLIRDDADVRHELQQRFSHLFVDEFQDTDPLWPRSSSCLPPTIPTAQNGVLCCPFLASCFSSATRSSRSTASDEPMSQSITR
jgi:hypothetical protein